MAMKYGADLKSEAKKSALLQALEEAGMSADYLSQNFTESEWKDDGYDAFIQQIDKDKNEYGHTVQKIPNQDLYDFSYLAREGNNYKGRYSLKDLVQQIMQTMKGGK